VHLGNQEFSDVWSFNETDEGNSVFVDTFSGAKRQRSFRSHNNYVTSDDPIYTFSIKSSTVDSIQDDESPEVFSDEDIDEENSESHIEYSSEDELEELLLHTLKEKQPSSSVPQNTALPPITTISSLPPLPTLPPSTIVPKGESKAEQKSPKNAAPKTKKEESPAKVEKKTTTELNTIAIADVPVDKGEISPPSPLASRTRSHTSPSATKNKGTKRVVAEDAKTPIRKRKKLHKKEEIASASQTSASQE
jgi:hypothetical protein